MFLAKYDMSYFSQAHIDHLYTQVNNPLEETVSICHECYKHVPALKYEIDNKLYLVKHCEEHGTHKYLIENDYKFYKSLKCSYDNMHFNDYVMIEVSDKCNIECPHCYHIPNNKIKDPTVDNLIRQIRALDRKMPDTWTVCLAGAESTLHKNFEQLLHEIKNYNSKINIDIMTNGIQFNNEKFVKKAKKAQAGVLVGLNHPSYINNSTVRKKQEHGLDNLHKHKVSVGYISYTMSTIEEMEDILKEITTRGWNPGQFRIRYGSDIGRNIGQDRLYLSDVYNMFKDWCEKNNVPFRLLEGYDNNLYHIMVKLGTHKIRLIQWCDEYDIDMENLISGPWSNFVPGGVTNFLNQIIRRNAWKNKGMRLLDIPPKRYLADPNPTKNKLDLRTLE